MRKKRKKKWAKFFIGTCTLAKQVPIDWFRIISLLCFVRWQKFYCRVRFDWSTGEIKLILIWLNCSLQGHFKPSSRWAIWTTKCIDLRINSHIDYALSFIHCGARQATDWKRIFSKRFSFFYPLRSAKRATKFMLLMALYYEVAPLLWLRYNAFYISSEEKTLRRKLSNSTAAVEAANVTMLPS